MTIEISLIGIKNCASKPLIQLNHSFQILEYVAKHCDINIVQAEAINAFCEFVTKETSLKQHCYITVFLYTNIISFRFSGLEGDLNCSIFRNNIIGYKLKFAAHDYEAALIQLKEQIKEYCYGELS